MLKNKLKQLGNVQGDPAVSILLNTHRTHPDNKQDAVTLKNLINEAEKRLYETYDKRTVWPIMESLRLLEAEIDHNYNLDSLAVFVAANTAEALKLPVGVEDRVIIDRNFATRDLVRALQQTERYYVLCISHAKARLLQAVNDKVVQEYAAGSPFPYLNKTVYVTDNLKKSMGNVQDNFSKEFFNRVDKEFQTHYKMEPLPLVLAGDERNIAYYREIADKNEWIIGSITGNYDDESPHEIITKTSEVVRDYVNRRRENALAEIEQAQSDQKLLDDLSDIYRAAQEGRADTLYVEKDFFQPALIEGDTLTVREDPTEPGVTDDIIDDIAETVMAYGGSVVFMPPGSLSEYRRIALRVRY
jgi:hypothetical protein